ncbi:G-alpha-domain-containing protein [Phellopilus nigrolimitatus]|nr:G-alpha-domain-containing protein [Phellopilus nigrolimitatus]
MAPPPNETPEERTSRIQQEEEATRISEAIDESLKLERQQARKRKLVKLLLLGQSESGKSTTLRQFQRLYTPSAFREERILWRSVIQLNLVRSVRKILDALSEHTDAVFDNMSVAEGDSDVDEHAFAAGLHELGMRLLPLRHIEQLLIAKLVPPDEDEATLFGLFGGGGGGTANSQEIFVRPGTAWKGFVARGKGMGGVRPQTPGSGPWTMDLQDEPTAVLHECRHDLMDLWRNPAVKEVLRKRKIRLEEQPGFFLNDLGRIAAPNYMPSDDDVLKARLKTVGVSEYKFEMETAAGKESGTEWRIIDVGGSRSQRPTWVPFFDDVDAIIFLAPISGFDQVLAEDKSVNRLEDSVLLWKMICSNKLLANVELVLFLNKCDILDRKLKTGVSLAKYVRSFQSRSNDVETVQKYFRAKFAAIQREYSPKPRKFYGFCTSVTEITTTSGILASVRDMVVREHLKRSRLL